MGFLVQLDNTVYFDVFIYTLHVIQDTLNHEPKIQNIWSNTTQFIVIVKMKDIMNIIIPSYMFRLSLSEPSSG
jgi:hypothetical protein